MANYREFLHADRTIGPVLGKGEEREESDSCCIRAWLSAQRDRRASGVHYATVSRWLKQLERSE